MKDRLILWWEKGGGSAPLVDITDKEVQNNQIFRNMMTDTNPHTHSKNANCVARAIKVTPVNGTAKPTIKFYGL